MRGKLPRRQIIGPDLIGDLDFDQSEDNREVRRQSWLPGQRWGLLCRYEREFGEDFESYCENQREKE